MGEQVGAIDGTWIDLEAMARADELTVAQIKGAIELLGEDAPKGAKKDALRLALLGFLKEHREAAYARLPAEEQRQRQRGEGPRCGRCKSRQTWVNQSYPVGSKLARAYPRVIAAQRRRRDCECGACGHRWTYDG